MSFLCSDEDGSKHFLVDFEQKALTARAERCRTQQQKADAANADQQKQDTEDHNLTAEKGEEEESDNPDEQWSVIFAVIIIIFYSIVPKC